MHEFNESVKKFKYIYIYIYNDWNWSGCNMNFLNNSISSLSKFVNGGDAASEAEIQCERERHSMLVLLWRSSYLN
jgi:hypothetical protein